MIKYLKDEKLEDLLTNDITIIDFYADWCGPCKMLGTILEQIDANVIKINTDDHIELAQKYGVMSIPNVFIYKDKKQVSKFVGFKTKDEINEIISNI